MKHQLEEQTLRGAGRGTDMHGQDAAGNELPVLPDAEVPRLYPHHVIEHELQVQTALHTHLRRPAVTHTHHSNIPLDVTLNTTHTCVNMGLPFCVTIVH